MTEKHDVQMIDKQYAVDQVRSMAEKFAELYFTFVCVLREEYGEEQAYRIAKEVLLRRARERAAGMVERAERSGVPREPGQIAAMTDVPFLGWVPELGNRICPYGSAWIDRIEEYPWFRRFAELHCAVTDKIICEMFTQTHSMYHRQNVVCGDDTCEVVYFESEDVKCKKYSYE